MSEFGNEGKQPVQGNWELQQEFLAAEQQRISNELFEHGVPARLMPGDEDLRGAKTDLSGLAQLDKVFVPSYGLARDGDQEERTLSLVAITEDPEKSSRSFTYKQVGAVDSAGILYPFPGVDPEDADRVHAAARQLEQAKADGVLPDLDFSLLSINNPRQAITHAR